MNSNLLKNCPACGNELTISELSCKNCGIKINGEFKISEFADLSTDELDFVKQFMLLEGNLSKMQVHYSENYNSIKYRLNSIKEKLGGNGMTNNINIENLTQSAEDSKVIKRLKDKIVECGGKAFMPVLKGEPVPFWLSSTKAGFESAGLKGFVFEWKVFDGIVKKAVSLGGKMYRGDVAAQSGAKIGSEDLPITTIDGYISTEFYGSKIGSATLRRSTYFSGILAWAGIATVHRSQGKGSFITINNEFLNLEN